MRHFSLNPWKCSGFTSHEIENSGSNHLRSFDLVMRMKLIEGPKLQSNQPRLTTPYQFNMLSCSTFWYFFAQTIWKKIFVCFIDSGVEQGTNIKKNYQLYLIASITTDTGTLNSIIEGLSSCSSPKTRPIIFFLKRRYMIEFKIGIILISTILSLEVYNDVSNELNPFSVQVKPASGWEAYMSTSKCKNSITFKRRQESIQYQYRSCFNGNYLNRQASS